MFSRVVVRAKQLGVLLGAITAVCTAYVALGLPIPMSEAAVTARINPIVTTLRDLRVTQHVILSDLSTLQRATLRNEKFALERALKDAEPSTKATLTIRMNQIADEIAKIDRRDTAVADRLKNEVQ
jgi:hypothetical protein